MSISHDRLQELLRRYAAGGCTRQEVLELFTAIGDAQHDEVLLASLQTLWQEIAPDDPMPVLDKEKIFRNVRRVRSAPVRRFGRMRVAAAVLLVLVAGGVGFAVYRQVLDRSPRLAAVRDRGGMRDVAPGGNKAVLILADGSHVELDSARNGDIGQQGGARVIKQDSDRLVYKRGKGGDGNVGAPGVGATLYNTIQTPRGGQYQVVLADGTKVWLDAASSLRFPIKFSGNERLVELTGEAYFEVAHDKIPFKVHIRNNGVDGGEVQVLGTHFNVNAYDDEAAIRTTLLEGSVRYVRGGSKKVLKPGQQAVAGSGAAASGKAGEDAIRVVSDADVEAAVAWKNGYFQFNGADTRTVMRQLSRWYDIDVSYEGTPPERQFGGGIARSKYLSVVLQVLEQSNIHFRLEGNKLVVTP
jgi:transmembrane sensor